VAAIPVGGSAEVRVGVALADMSEFVAIDPAYGIGDQRAQFEALLAAELDARGAPHGVTIVPVFRTFSSTTIDHKRAVADEFAADRVLCVLGARDFTYGAVRLAETHAVPVIDVNAIPRALFARTDPWMFTIRAAQDLVYLTYVDWAHSSGLLDGQRIGVFSDRYTATSASIAIDHLTALGHAPVAHVPSDGVGVGSDHDVAAAERFWDAGVDVIVPFVSGSSMARMLRAATATGYRPRIVDLETGEHATDVSGSVMPAEIYEGTPALVMSRIGEVAAGRPLAPVAEQAVAAVERATGRSIARSGRATSGELSNVLLVADLVAILCTALRAAAPDPTREQLVAAIEQIDSMPSASGGAITFRPHEHWGCREMRAIEWRSGGWRAVSAYTPITPAAAD
jgi:ABC-type branched-subunit amino acid transport system substrate-binding protein